MKIMISQPMRGRSEEEIKKERETIIEKFNKLHIEVIDTLFQEEVEGYNTPALYYLSKSILCMGKVDAVYFAKGWETARGCKIEREIAREYGIKILNTDFLEDYNTVFIRK